MLSLSNGTGNLKTDKIQLSATAFHISLDSTELIHRAFRQTLIPYRILVFYAVKRILPKDNYKVRTVVQALQNLQIKLPIQILPVKTDTSLIPLCLQQRQQMFCLICRISVTI